MERLRTWLCGFLSNAAVESVVESARARLVLPARVCGFGAAGSAWGAVAGWLVLLLPDFKSGYNRRQCSGKVGPGRDLVCRGLGGRCRWRVGPPGQQRTPRGCFPEATWPRPLDVMHRATGERTVGAANPPGWGAPPRYQSTSGKASGASSSTDGAPPQHLPCHPKTNPRKSSFSMLVESPGGKEEGREKAGAHRCRHGP